MIVDKIDIEGVSAFKPEDDPPVAAHTHGPEASEFAGQRVQNEPRQVYVFDTLCRMQPEENTTQAFNLP